VKGIGLGWLWSSYNLIMIGVALLILLDVPKPDLQDWFDLRRTVRLIVRKPEPNQQEEIRPWGNERTVSASDPLTSSMVQLWGSTTMLSEDGAEIALTQGDFPALAAADPIPVMLEIMEENLTFQGLVTQQGVRDEFPTVRVQFQNVSMEQQRRLIEILFCRPGQWKRRNTPGELQSLLLLFKALLRPRILFDRDADTRAIAVAKG
jgi:cellulose synthase (UDP-forming)